MGVQIPLPALDEDRVREIGNISPFWQSNVLRIAFERLRLKGGDVSGRKRELFLSLRLEGGFRC